MSRSSRPGVTIVSPHFDDAPLSLGQSLLDGPLARCRVRVLVVFGRTNWTRWFFPGPGRAPAVSAWRRCEETVASVAFGYSVRVDGWEEMILRTGERDPEVLRDAAADPASDPLVDELLPTLRRLRGSGDVVLFPAGIGDHLDHRLVATAGARLAAEHDDHLGFYEDRPYVSHLTPAQREEQVGRLGLDLVPHDASGPVTAAVHRRLRRCYPSQISGEFLDAMSTDLAAGARERVWLPAGPTPPWLQPRGAR